MDKLYVIIPAYNEEENIEAVLADWYSVVEAHPANGESRLVVIDDGSRDTTFELMQRFAETHPLFVPLTKPNSGHGATVLFGYNHALKNGADYVFQTDSDGQTLSSEFEQFWQCRQENELVIGWRNHRQDGASRVFVTFVLKQVVRLIFHVSVKDANTPFRLYQAEALRENISFVPKDFNLSNVALSAIFVKKGCRVRFIPITFRPRQAGKNSINLPKIAKLGWNALKDFRSINKSLEK